jgi:CheY-like chemotaxis protein
MPDAVGATAPEPVQGVLLDLLMPVMDSFEIWPPRRPDPRRDISREIVIGLDREVGPSGR